MAGTDEDLARLKVQFPRWSVTHDSRVGFIAVSHLCRVFAAGIMVKEISVSADTPEELARLIDEVRGNTSGGDSSNAWTQH